MILDQIYRLLVRLEVVNNGVYPGVEDYRKKEVTGCVEWCANEYASVEGMANKRRDVVVFVLVGNRIFISTEHLLPPGLLLPICQPSLEGIVGDEMPKQHQNQCRLPSHNHPPCQYNMLEGRPAQQVIAGDPSQFRL